MSDKLEAYLAEIGRFLSGRAEREEILSEIRSHILEKSSAERGGDGEAALEAAIAAYGPARRVAETYLEDKPIIAPVYLRFLARYTALLFAVHGLLTVFAVACKKSFVIFPFLFMPRLGVIDALMYLPTAFLADLGFVALVLHLITRSGRDVRLPWPRFSVDLDEVRPPRKAVWNALGFAAMLAVTGFALYVYAKARTLFVINFDLDAPRRLLTPAADERASLIVLALLVTGTAAALARIFTRSRWVDVASDALSLGFFGLLLRQPLEGAFAVPLPERLLPFLKVNLRIVLLIVAVFVAVDLVKNLIAIGRRKV
ncbi:MAG: hypothetical protein JW742_03090 [Candidatus Aminicenantes bacterium]|nr:hypothetical protein [Candidatus Aminicenantes bacterium]